MEKDWIGNKKSTYVTIGASSHSDHARQHEDYYATSPEATEWLLRLEKFHGPILEPACGEGHISKVLSRGGVRREGRPSITLGGLLLPKNTSFLLTLKTNL